MRCSGQENLERIVQIGLRVAEVLFEVTAAERDLSLRGEVPRQLAEDRLVDEVLMIRLEERSPIGTEIEQTVGKLRAQVIVTGTPLRNRTLVGAWLHDIPGTVANRMFEVHTGGVVDHTAWLRVRYQTH